MKSAQPIRETINAASHVMLAGVLLFLGAQGQPVVVPPFWLFAFGLAISISATASVLLAWQHWRLAAAIKDLEESRARIAELRKAAGEP